MAATGFTPIQLYRTSTAAAVPTSGNLADGELAINLTDEILYFKNAAGTVKLLSANITPIANGGTGATTNTAARTNLGATTLGANLFTVANPSAVTFPRFNADNTVSTLDAASFRTAIGAGTGGGSVSSVSGTGTVNGITLSGTVTSTGNITLGGALSGVSLTTQVTGTLPVANGGTGATSLTANNVLLGNGTSALQVVAPGTSGNVLTSNGTTWTSAAVAATLSGITQSSSPFETSLGFEAGLNVTGLSNTLVGYQAGKATNAGARNVAVGHLALTAGTSVADFVAIGSSALAAASSGTGHTAVGSSALASATTSSGNTAVGWLSLNSTTTGGSNVGVGTGTLRYNLTSEGSTAVGANALRDCTAGNNSALGFWAGLGVTSGTGNTLLGSRAGYSGTNDLTTGSNNIIIGQNAEASSATVSNEVTLGATTITSTRLRGMVELNAAMFEAATITATAATGTINFDARTQSVLYYTSNASGNWTLNIRAASGVSLDSVMTTGESMTVAFLATNGATAFYQTGFQVDGSSVTPRWQGGTAPTAGNASSIDAYVITVIKTGSATFVVLASQTRFA